MRSWWLLNEKEQAECREHLAMFMAGNFKYTLTKEVPIKPTGFTTGTEINLVNNLADQFLETITPSNHNDN
jgi:hypothetical protein